MSENSRWLLEIARATATERDYAAELRREKMRSAHLQEQIDELTAALRRSEQLAANRADDCAAAVLELAKIKTVLARIAGV